MDSMELTVCDNVLEGGEQRDNSSSSTSSPESDKVARQPNRRRDQKRDVEIRPQSVEEEEEGGDPGGFRVHPSTSRVYNRRLRWILLAVLSAAVVMLALTVNLLHEKWLEAITERVAQVLFGCGPDETGTVGDVTKDECFGLRLSVEDNLKLLFAATMVISLVGVVINAATLTTVCRNQVPRSPLKHLANRFSPSMRRAFTTRGCSSCTFAPRSASSPSSSCPSPPSSGSLSAP